MPNSEREIQGGKFTLPALVHDKNRGRDGGTNVNGLVGNYFCKVIIMIAEITKILYATDLSENSLYAFGYAVQIARQCGAKITVLHVVEPGAATFGNWVKEDTEGKESVRSREIIRGHLERFCEIMDKDRTCIELVSNILVRVGQPAETILGLAEEEGSDILVLGTHGKQLLRNALLGSVSREVLYRTSRPVVAVPVPNDKLNWEEL
ncbi:MAG: universal stress protein [Syntrophorhabdales bacterium]